MKIAQTGGGDTLRGVWGLWMEHTSMLQSLLQIGLVIVTEMVIFLSMFWPFVTFT
ncbi:hypothetical protein ACS0TY_006166 [Phlomoides rotata]